MLIQILLLVGVSVPAQANSACHLPNMKVAPWAELMISTQAGAVEIKGTFGRFKFQKNEEWKYLASPGAFSSVPMTVVDWYADNDRKLPSIPIGDGRILKLALPGDAAIKGGGANIEEKVIFSVDGSSRQSNLTWLAFEGISGLYRHPTRREIAYILTDGGCTIGECSCGRINGRQGAYEVNLETLEVQHTYPKALGFRDAAIYSMFVRKNEVWFGTGGGVCRYLNAQMTCWDLAQVRFPKAQDTPTFQSPRYGEFSPTAVSSIPSVARVVEVINYGGWFCRVIAESTTGDDKGFWVKLQDVEPVLGRFDAPMAP